MSMAFPRRWWSRCGRRLVFSCVALTLAAARAPAADTDLVPEKLTDWSLALRQAIPIGPSGGGPRETEQITIQSDGQVLVGSQWGEKVFGQNLRLPNALEPAAVDRLYGAARTVINQFSLPKIGPREISSRPAYYQMQLRRPDGQFVYVEFELGLGNRFGASGAIAEIDVIFEQCLRDANVRERELLRDARADPEADQRWTATPRLPDAPPGWALLVNDRRNEAFNLRPWDGYHRGGLFFARCSESALRFGPRYYPRDKAVSHPLKPDVAATIYACGARLVQGFRFAEQSAAEPDERLLMLCIKTNGGWGSIAVAYDHASLERCGVATVAKELLQTINQELQEADSERLLTFYQEHK